MSGRGDTRGEAEDEKMWNKTIDAILRKSKEQEIDGIVWVVNAAWQRGVAMREMMLKELRRSFGYHLYEHLDLVFNFLAHVANKSEYGRRCCFLSARSSETGSWSRRTSSLTGRQNCGRRFQLK